MLSREEVFPQGDQVLAEKTKELMDLLNRGAQELISRDAVDRIPHLVLSGGFMSWNSIACDIFPQLAWRGREEELQDNPKASYEVYMKPLYDRFVNQLAKMSALGQLTEEQRLQLQQDGWETYLED